MEDIYNKNNNTNEIITKMTAKGVTTFGGTSRVENATAGVGFATITITTRVATVINCYCCYLLACDGSDGMVWYR